MLYLKLKRRWQFKNSQLCDFMSICLLLNTQEQERQQCKTEEQVYCHPAFLL